MRYIAKSFRSEHSVKCVDTLQKFAFLNGSQHKAGLGLEEMA